MVGGECPYEVHVAIDRIKKVGRQMPPVPGQVHYENTGVNRAAAWTGQGRQPFNSNEDIDIKRVLWAAILGDDIVHI